MVIADKSLVAWTGCGGVKRQETKVGSAARAVPADRGSDWLTLN
jgi:hypothetical protein